MARIWAPTVFLLGYDTFTRYLHLLDNYLYRLLLPKYYEDDPEKVKQALEEFKERQARFLIAGR